ncbi:MAG: CapA family protein [Clostridia bacterium]|nr:CapA family protein [Clostridia bacterium]
MTIRKTTRGILCLLLALLLLSSCVFRPNTPPVVPGSSQPATEPVTAPDPETTEPETTVPATSEPETTEPATTEPETTSPPPHVPEVREVTLIAAGDNIVYKGTWIDAARGQPKGSYDFTKMYERVRDLISGADIAFINQETLMCGEGYELTGYPAFNGPQQMGYDLLTVGFDVIGMANNHMCDYGSQGLAASRDFLKSLTDGVNTMIVGGYESRADADTIRVYEKNGIRIAFLAYTYGTNKKTDGNGVFVPVLDEEMIASQVAAAKEAADVVIVAAHWGSENSFSPSSSEKKWAQYLADCGVDIILGAHPHVIQPIVVLTGSSGHQTLCAYSLGNFLAEQDTAKNLLGGLLSLKIVMTDGVVSVEDVVFRPTVCHVDGSWHNIIYELKDYTQELADTLAVTTYYKNGKVTPAMLREYYESTIPEEYRVREDA